MKKIDTVYFTSEDNYYFHGIGDMKEDIMDSNINYYNNVMKSNVGEAMKR